MAWNMDVLYRSGTVSFHVKFESCFGHKEPAVGELECGIVLLSW